MQKLILLIFLPLVLWACSTKTPAVAKPENTKDTLDLAEARQNLRGAIFKETVRSTAEIFFSNAKQADKFELIVPPGLLSQTQAALRITDKSGRLIYADTLDTRYFAKFVWNPDTVPAALSNDAYEKYLLNYVASVSKEQVERFARYEIEHFFDNITFDRSQIKAITKFSDSESEPFYKEISADTSRKIICLPCFSCETDGRCYMAWSPKQKKVITLQLADE